MGSRYKSQDSCRAIVDAALCDGVSEEESSEHDDRWNPVLFSNYQSTHIG